jgi:hypothetical protein
VPEIRVDPGAHGIDINPPGLEAQSSKFRPSPATTPPSFASPVPAVIHADQADITAAVGVESERAVRPPPTIISNFRDSEGDVALMS